MQLDGFAIIHDRLWFQSSSNLLAGCIVGIGVGRSILGLVSILTQSRGGVWHHQQSSSGACLFQSSPDLWAGRNVPIFPIFLVDVSILIQPIGWVQCPHLSNFSWLTFQSTPDLWAGRNVVSIHTQPLDWVWHHEAGRFQGMRVSILTQPLGWVQYRVRLMLLLISILTQPMGWVQPDGSVGFQSSSNR